MVHLGRADKYRGAAEISSPSSRDRQARTVSLGAARLQSKQFAGCRYNCRTMKTRPRIHHNAAEMQPGARVLRIDHPKQGLWEVQRVDGGDAFLKNDRGGTAMASIATLEVKELAKPGFVPRGDGLERCVAVQRRAAPTRPRERNAKSALEVERVMAAENSYQVLGLSPKIELDSDWHKIMKTKRNELIKSVHPDHGGTDEATRKAYAAFDNLKKPICDREVTVPYEISRNGRVLKSRDLVDGDVVFYKTNDGQAYPKAVVCKHTISNIFDIILDEGDGAAPRERCNVKGGDLTPVQLQPTVSPSPSPSRDHDDDDAFAPPPDTSDDEAAPTSPERQLAKRPAEDRLVPRPKRPKSVRSLIWQWRQSRQQSGLFGDLQERFEKIVADASDAEREKLVKQKAMQDGFRICLKQAGLADDCLMDLDAELAWSDPTRAINVLLLCGGMGACLLAMYNVGLAIEVVMNWETNVEARSVLEVNCRKRGIRVETGVPRNAPLAVERPPASSEPVEGNVELSTAQEISRSYDVVSATGPCQDVSRANNGKLGFDGPHSAPHFYVPTMIQRVLMINPRAQVLVENVIKEAEHQRRFNGMYGLPHVRVGTDGAAAANTRPRALQTTMPPVDERPRGYATFQDALDALYGRGVYEALVDRIPCLKASTRPTCTVKMNCATGAEEELAIEEALLLMGFPVDWFEGCGLDDDDEAAKWRLIGNSCNVGDLELFYKSLLRVHKARHGRDVAAEREEAIQAFRAKRGF